MSSLNASVIVNTAAVLRHLWKLVLWWEHSVLAISAVTA